MRSRNNLIQVWLNDVELKKLNANLEKSGLTRANYLRHLINGYVPNEIPPLDFHHMMEQLYQVGNNLNQIAKKAHVLNVIDASRYDEAMKSYTDIINEITEAMILPRKMK